tara:strand:+ start:181 stop:858 length:678 start_codon:yes stop_codon:yes gene_type:complete
MDIIKAQFMRMFISQNAKHTFCKHENPLNGKYNVSAKNALTKLESSTDKNLLLSDYNGSSLSTKSLRDIYDAIEWARQDAIEKSAPKDILTKGSHHIRLGTDGTTKWINKSNDDHWIKISDHKGSGKLGGTLAVLDFYTNGTLIVDGKLKVGNKVYSNDDLRRALDNALNSVQKGTEYDLDGNTNPVSCLTTAQLDKNLGGDNWDTTEWIKKGHKDNSCIKVKLH